MTSYAVLGSYPALPGKCIACGGVATPVLDTGISIDYYGGVFFCVEDAKALGRSVGLVDPTPVAEIKESPLTQEEINQHHVDVEAVIAILGDMRDRYYNLSNHMEAGDAEAPEPEVSSGESESPDGQVSELISFEGSPSFPSSSGDVPKFDFNIAT